MGLKDTEIVARRPRVVIVGGGFGGIHAAHGLRDLPLDVTLIDRTNHSVFFPLLYQVATAGLSSDEVATPIRSLLRSQHNLTVLMLEMAGIDPERKVVLTNEREIPYDFLVLATGVHYNYFGHDDWQQHAPSLKTVSDAIRIRRKILHAFERAERADDSAEIEALLTFVLVGGGPTGVELAGAIAELARRALAPEYRNINTGSARIILVERRNRILGGFPPSLAEKSRRALEKIGVEIRTSSEVTCVDEAGVVVAGERIASHNVVWTAGVVAPDVGRWLDAPTDRIGRILVDANLRVPSHPEVFVVGDLAHIERDGTPLPGVAQVAMQGGNYVARQIREATQGHTTQATFAYWDKGNMATVGRSFAIADLGMFQMSGRFAWLMWLAVHIYYLTSLRNRLQVLLQWAWAYFTFDRGVRVLTPDTLRTAALTDTARERNELPGVVDTERQSPMTERMTLTSGEGMIVVP